MRAARHAARIGEVLAVTSASCDAAAAQRRSIERAVRVDCLAFRRWCLAKGRGSAELSEQLNLAGSTLASWERGWKTDRLVVQSRGRPPACVTREVRNQIIGVMRVCGPGIGIPALRMLFPDVARRALERLLRRYRRVYRKRYGKRWGNVLRWTRPGAVWAMDFTEPPKPIDGIYSDVLVVRDLAAGKTLAALPVHAQSADAVRDLLVALFARHGAPLVIKSDNGSPLIAACVRELLRSRQILALLSPPGLPSYNGACEAGIGGLKTRAHHIAARHGRPDEWTCDDVEAARLMANQTARPRGASGPTPEEAWATATPVTDAERALLHDAVECARHEQRLENERNETRLDAAAIERFAIGRALIELGPSTTAEDANYSPH